MRMLVDREFSCVKANVDLDAIDIADRSFTGAGFSTEFTATKELRVLEAGASMRWAKVGARLNRQKLETGYVIYIDDGYMWAVEGYTYGDEWPENVDMFEVYDRKAGVELVTKPRA